MLSLILMLACTTVAPADIDIDPQPCGDGSSVAIDTLEGLVSCKSCPCDVPLLLPNASRATSTPRAAGTFTVSTQRGTRHVRCSWDSQWAVMHELAATEFGAVAQGQGQDVARLLWDDAGLRVSVPNGGHARCMDVSP